MTKYKALPIQWLNNFDGVFRVIGRMYSSFHSVFRNPAADVNQVLYIMHVMSRSRHSNGVNQEVLLASLSTHTPTQEVLQ